MIYQPEHRRCWHASPIAHILVWVVLSILFTAVIVQYSFRHGRLLFPPTFDDVVYFVSGLRQLDLFYQEGLLAVIHGYIQSPPHSPFATYLSALSFGIFGMHDWAPYCGNVIIIFLLLAFVDYLLGMLAFWLKVMMLLFTLTLPFVGIAIHEFRPDIAWGLLTAMGTILMVINQFLTSDIRDKLPGIICFVFALLIKPSALPITFLMLCCALCGVIGLEKIFLGDRSPVRYIVKHVTLFLTLIGIGIAPHYLLASNHIITYLYVNLVQNASIWAYQGTFTQHALFYLTGNGGQVMLGKHLYLLGIILIIGGFVQFKLCTKEVSLRFVLLCVLTWIAWLIPTTQTTKTYFIGIVFDVLLFFSTMLVFRNVLNSLVIRHHIHRQMLVAAVMLSLTIIGGIIATFPAQLGEVGSPHVKAINRVTHDVFHTIVKYANNNARIYFTTVGYVNKAIFDYLVITQGIDINLQYQAEAVANPQVWNARFDNADFVIASELGTGRMVQETFPSAQRMNESLELLRSRGDFQELASFPTDTGKKLFVFQKRIAPHIQLDAMQSVGFWDIEGPYPQLTLPKPIRWMVAPRSSVRISHHDDHPVQCSLNIKVQTQILPQTFTVLLNGNTLLHKRFTTFSHWHEWKVENVPIQAGENVFEFEATNHINPDSQIDPRSLYLLFEELTLQCDSYK